MERWNPNPPGWTVVAYYNPSVTESGDVSTPRVTCLSGRVYQAHITWARFPLADPMHNLYQGDLISDGGIQC